MNRALRNLLSRLVAVQPRRSFPKHYSPARSMDQKMVYASAFFKYNRELFFYIIFFAYVTLTISRAVLLFPVLGLDVEALYRVESKAIALALLVLFCLGGYWRVNPVPKITLVAASVVLSAFSAIDAMLLTLFILCAEGSDIKALALVSMVAMLLIGIPSILGNLLGVVPDVESFRVDGSRRFAYGFAHPNGFGLFVFMITLDYIVIRYGRLRLAELLVPIGSVAIILGLCDSRTMTIMALLLVVLVWMGRFEGKSGRVGWIGFSVGVLAAAGSYALLALYRAGLPFAHMMDRVLSQRLNFGSYYLTKTPPALMGRDYSAVPLPNNPNAVGVLLDNAYYRLLLVFGIVFTVVFLTSIIIFLFRSAKRGTTGVIFWGIVVFCVVGVAESAMLCFAYNYFLSGLCSLGSGEQSGHLEGKGSSRIQGPRRLSDFK